MVRWLSLVLLVCAVAAPASAQQQQPLSVLTVTGEATIDAAPDLAQLRVGVTTQGKSARDASDANAKAMNAVMAALKTAGIAERDLQTSRLSLNPTREPDRGNGGRITGFQAANQVVVRIREIARMAEIIDGVVAAGANDIGGIEFIIAEPGPLLDKARPAAMADAHRKAEIYAKAAGLTLGRVMSIAEEGLPSPVMVRAGMSVAAMPTPVAPGERTLRLSVVVNYQIAP